MKTSYIKPEIVARQLILNTILEAVSTVPGDDPDPAKGDFSDEAFGE